VQWPTLSHCVEKTEFSRKESSARFAIRQVGLNGRALITLQLAVEV
jgi:hypothetical protein